MHIFLLKAKQTSNHTRAAKMPKKRSRKHHVKRLQANEVNINQDVEIKYEPIDDGYYEPMPEVPPTQIYRETDENWANIEAETGLVSQLDIIKTEVDVDEATIQAFCDDMAHFNSSERNEENIDEPAKKKRKRDAKQTKRTKGKNGQKNERRVGLIEPSKSSSPSSAAVAQAESEPEPIEIVVNGVKMAKCRFCDFQITRRNRSIVKQHMRIHTGITPHACKHCPKKFYTRNILIAHVQSAHPTKTMHKCPLCKIYFFTAKDFQAHELKCVKRSTFECHLCKCQENRFRLRDAKEHMRRFHTGEKIYQCKYCDEDAFLTKNSLAWHVKHCHPEALPFKCSLCQTGFASEENYTKHVDYCLNRKRFECHLCRYMVPLSNTFETLKKHMRLHTGEL